jgi:Predicted acyltransferases
MINIVKNITFLDKTHTSVLKGVAILLVILGHLGFINHSGAYGVAIFLIISGFGLTQSYLKNGTKDFLIKRYNKVLLPYMFITTIWFIIDKIVFKTTYPINEVIKTVVGIQPKSPIDPSMWYITFLLLWYMAFYFIFSLPQNNYSKVLMIFIVSYLAYKYKYYFSSDSGAGLYVLEFPIGICLGFLYNKIKQIKTYRLNVLFCIVAVLFGFLYRDLSKSIDVSFNNYLLSILTMSISIICITSILISINNINILSLFNILFDKLGSISYEIYLIEFMIMLKYYSLFTYIGNRWIRLIIFLLSVSALAILLKITINLIRKFGVLYIKKLKHD